MFRSLDWITIALYLILVTMGATSIYAASYDFDTANIFDFNEFSGKQFAWIGLSLIIGCVILLMDYRIYETYAYPIYGAMILLLLLTAPSACSLPNSARPPPRLPWQNSSAHTISG